MRSIIFISILSIAMASTPENEYLKALRAEAKARGGYITPVSEKTPSMLGSGYAGNIIMVIPAKEYAEGDDVVYKRGGGGTGLHRVTHTKPGQVFTKGTFNSTGDGWISLADVLGRVEGLYDKEGRPKEVKMKPKKKAAEVTMAMPDEMMMVMPTAPLKSASK